MAGFPYPFNLLSMLSLYVAAAVYWIMGVVK